LHTVAAHINDDAFAQSTLMVFDRWVTEGLIKPGYIGPASSAALDMTEERA
jgi:hypothetical protein